VQCKTPWCAGQLRSARRGACRRPRACTGNGWVDAPGDARGRAFPPRPRSSMRQIVGQTCFRSAEACQATQTQFLVRAAGESRDPRQKRSGTRICEGAVRAWKASASRAFHVLGSHGRQARSTVVQLAYGVLTVLAPRARETLRPRAAAGVGHRCLGRAHPRRSRTIGMATGDLGLHDDARAGMPSTSGGMNTARSWQTLTSVSKPGAISQSARCRAPSV
jgi:hypothetical protein